MNWFQCRRIVIIFIIATLWAAGEVSATPSVCPEAQMRAVAEKQEIERGMDANSMLEAVRGLCMAQQNKERVKDMWTAYAEYYVRVAQFKKELAVFPMDGMKELEERGGRVPADLVAPMRRLGIAALRAMTSSQHFHSKAIEVNVARLKACGNDFNLCLKRAQATIDIVVGAIDNVKALEPHLIHFSLLSVVDKDWRCCINMSREGGE